jgi:hypothetical protein
VTNQSLCLAFGGKVTSSARVAGLGEWLNPTNDMGRIESSSLERLVKMGTKGEVREGRNSSEPSSDH